MFRKGLVVGIIVLFIGMSVIPSTGSLSKVSSVSKSNNPPYEPSNPIPFNGTINMSICPPYFSWSGGDPDGDYVTYDVYFGDSSPPPQVGWNQSETWFMLYTILEFEKTYYWYVVAWDEYGAYTEGPIWSFTTEENLPPYVPSQPYPEDGEPHAPKVLTLRWNCSDPNECDTLTYDLYFDDYYPPYQREWNISDNWWVVPFQLPSQVTFYWRVVAWDSGGLFTEGPIWSFTTGHNHPPDTPVIEGKRRFREGEGGRYPYKIYSIDPDDHYVRYLINWNDGMWEWTDFYESGEKIIINVTIPSEKGTYILFKIRAEDIFGAESDWAILEITVPRTKATTNSLLLWFLERFPLLEQLLNVLGWNIE